MFVSLLQSSAFEMSTHCVLIIYMISQTLMTQKPLSLNLLYFFYQDRGRVIGEEIEFFERTQIYF